jgi:hypothetical protein
MFSSRNSLPRRSITVDGCSMKIREDVRKFAAQQGIDEDAALEIGLQEKAKEFVKKTLPSTLRPSSIPPENYGASSEINQGYHSGKA